MINLIPKPLSESMQNGKCQITTKSTIGGAFVKSYNILSTMLKACLGSNLAVIEKGAFINFVKETNLDKEEYVLNINHAGIKIQASDEVGAFYAVQSLRQILELDTIGKVNTIVTDCVLIKDKPRFAYRGFMLDEARHFFGKEFVKQLLDMMSMLKFNIFHWHLTDDQGWRVEIKKYPLLTEKGSIRKNTQLNLVGYNSFNEKHDDVEYGRGKHYTQTDLKEIVAYATKLNINIVPEVDMPGHLVSAIACYPELSCFDEKVEVSTRWGVMDTICCCGKPIFYKFAKDIIDELVEIFPYKYFHIGGDEVPKTKWKKCPNCQAKIKELGLKDEEDLQGYFNNEILKYLNTKNRNIIGWNEILKATTLSPETVVQYWTGNSKLTGVSKWIEKGNQILLTYCPRCYFDHFYSMKDLRLTYAMDLDTLGLDPKFEKQVLGIEAPQWTEYVRDKEKFDFNTYPRLQALAEICWTAKENKNFEDFDNRLESFKKIMDKFNIGYAPREAYICKGFKGLIRKIYSHKNWVNEPYSEMYKYRGKR